MSVAILLPVLDRPHRIVPLLENIARATPEEHVVYFAASDQLTLDQLDQAGANYLPDGGDTWPNRINRLFAWTFFAEYVFLCADDVLFHDGWLPPLLAAQAEMGPIGGVAVPNDLHNPYGTLALVSRRYVNEVGAVLDTPGAVVYSGYQHNWSDTELFATAAKRGRHRYVEGSVVEHLHHGIGKSPADATYAKGMASFNQDQALYSSRLALWA